MLRAVQVPVLRTRDWFHRCDDSAWHIFRLFICLRAGERGSAAAVRAARLTWPTAAAAGTAPPAAPPSSRRTPPPAHCCLPSPCSPAADRPLQLRSLQSLRGAALAMRAAERSVMHGRIMSPRRAEWPAVGARAVRLSKTRSYGAALRYPGEQSHQETCSLSALLLLLLSCGESSTAIPPQASATVRASCCWFGAAAAASCCRQNNRRFAHLAGTRASVINTKIQREL